MDMHSRSNAGEGNGGKSAPPARLGEEPRRNDFLAQLNQELRTLDAIMGFAQHLEGQCDNASMTDNIKQVQKAANDLLDIIGRKLAEPVHRPDGDKAKTSADSQCDVLHIEDDSVTFASVKLLLGSQRNLKVLRAINGENGIALAQEHAPRLILLDLDLPDIHGSEVIQRLQKETATARIPVIVLSGDATSSQIERLLVLGARNYVTKPFKIPAFLAVVDGILEETPRSKLT
jgi:CheY-like chemotaxis protein